MAGSKTNPAYRRIYLGYEKYRARTPIRSYLISPVRLFVGNHSYLDAVFF